MEYAKVKSVGKDVLVKGPTLEKKILTTMQTVADLVGATLGPGGHPVLIERQEINMPNMVTKDGVTVFKAIGFTDPVAHAIMESARDASVRTASEAGDGTTTATILANAIVKNMNAYAKANPHISPQKIVRKLEKTFKDVIEPAIRKQAIPAKFSTKKGRELLWNVAKISANGDTALADAVMECFKLVGDKGNVTITEISGASAYEVERIEGYPVPLGYEDSCMNYYPKFVNDPENQRVNLENPIFVLYAGRITDIQSIVFLMERIGMAWQADGFNHNVVLCATGFSESVVAQLALNFAEPTTINVYPLMAPRNAIPTSQMDFLLDMAAITGATIYDPLNTPLPRSHEEVDLTTFGIGPKAFEAFRFRSTVIGQRDEVLVLERVQQLEKQIKNAASQLEALYFEERLGKLTGGIAKLKVIGASNGELREKRDRAEDAVMGVRKAIEQGCLPGGGWMLMKLVGEILALNDEDLNNVLVPALMEPFHVLFYNLGFSHEEIVDKFWNPMMKHVKDGKQTVYDALEGKWVDAVSGGVLDSTPAVLEAIRNSLSIASLLGTLGGTIVFQRNSKLETQDALDTAEFLRNANVNEANERL
jgi:chaperonin GroEL